MGSPAGGRPVYTGRERIRSPPRRQASGVGMARITLEDLNGLDDESLDEDEEPMDREEQNRLFSHWETVASTHQVTLPPEMAGPILQMTRHSQVREPVPYVTLLQHEKVPAEPCGTETLVILEQTPPWGANRGTYNRHRTLHPQQAPAFNGL